MKARRLVCVCDRRELWNNYRWRLKPSPTPSPLYTPAPHHHLLSAKYSIIQPLSSVTGLSNGFGVDPKKLIALDQYCLQTIKNHTRQTWADKGTYTNVTNARNTENAYSRFTCIIISITALCIKFNCSWGMYGRSLMLVRCSNSVVIIRLDFCKCVHKYSRDLI